MELSQVSDEYWKKRLSKRLYAILRLGEMEKPNTGKYQYTKISGVYHCAGCNASLLNSDTKQDGDSGHAAFLVSTEDTAVMASRTYTPEGEELNTVVCGTCMGKLGTVSDMNMRSSKDLEESTQFFIAHIHSDAVTFKKYVTPKNYPVSFILVLLAIGVGGYFVIQWGNTLVDVSSHQRINNTLSLWIADTEIHAPVIHLSTVNAETQSMVFGDEALFAVYGEEETVSMLKLPDEPVDVIWISDSFEVVKVEVDMMYDKALGHEVFEKPTSAVFALITRPMLLPTDTIREGSEVIVLDKTDLL